MEIFIWKVGISVLVACLGILRPVDLNAETASAGAGCAGTSFPWCCKSVSGLE